MLQRVVGWFLALSVVWLIDGATSLLSRSEAAGFGAGDRLALGAPLYFGWLTVLGAAALGALHAWAGHSIARATSALGFEPGYVNSRALVAAMFAAFALGAYEAALFSSTAFHNHQLASLLLVLELFVTALLWLAVAPVLAGFVRKLSRMGEGPRWLSAIGLWLCALCAVGYMLWDNRGGFAQLPRGMRAGGIGFVLAAPLCLKLAGPLSRAMRPATLAGVLGCFAILSMVVSGEWHTYAAYVESESGPAGLTLDTLRKATDFDRDGASGWFGGGDCAPFDRNVHPLAVEIIADGIDNNCLGGDRKKPVTSPPPKWTGPMGTKGAAQNLVLLTIDTVRPDHTSMFGYSRDTTPQLNRHAGRSVLFERTYTAAPLTRLAMSSLFSAQRASQVVWDESKRRGGNARVDPNQPWLPRLLQQQGFATAAFVPRFVQFERRGHGFDQGFSRYDYASPMTYDGGSMQGFPAQRQIDKAIRWLDEAERKRFFLWVHLVEPHFEYQRHESAPDFGEGREDLYDSDLWYADSQAGRFLDALRERGRFEDTVIVVAGDHGESFSEHGHEYHGYELYEPSIRTLGMLSAPGLAPGRVEAPVSLIDIVPTVLNLLDVDHGYEGFRGQNLLPALMGSAEPRAQVVVELFRLPLVGYEIALVEERFKLYYAAASRQVRMFDLKEDPDERHPLPTTHPEYGRLLDHLTAVFEQARASREKKPDRAAKPKRAAKSKRSKTSAEARDAGAAKQAPETKPAVKTTSHAAQQKAPPEPAPGSKPSPDARNPSPSSKASAPDAAAP